jgi:hypothetical protein
MSSTRTTARTDGPPRCSRCDRPLDSLSQPDARRPHELLAACPCGEWTVVRRTARRLVPVRRIPAEERARA